MLNNEVDARTLVLEGQVLALGKAVSILLGLLGDNAREEAFRRLKTDVNFSPEQWPAGRRLPVDIEEWSDEREIVEYAWSCVIGALHRANGEEDWPVRAH